jgi:hypothetical protein
VDRLPAPVAPSAIAYAFDRVMPNRSGQDTPPRVVAGSHSAALLVQHRSPDTTSRPLRSYRDRKGYIAGATEASFTPKRHDARPGWGLPMRDPAVLPWVGPSAGFLDDARRQEGRRVTRAQVFPALLIVLDLTASVVYAVEADVRRSVYWFAAAVLTVVSRFDLL